MRDTYAENCKTLLKEIKDLNKQKKTKNPLSQDKSTSRERISMPPNHSIPVQSLKVLMAFSAKWKRQSLNSHGIAMDKQSKQWKDEVGKFKPLDFKIYYNFSNQKKIVIIL